MSHSTSKISPARRAAWEVLSAWLATGPDKGRLGSPKRPFPPPTLDLRDRVFARRLAEATVQRFATLDAILLSLAKGRKPRPHGLHAALLLSAWELLFTPDTPSRAIVHEGVDMARLSAKEGGARFANAVLRKLADQRELTHWLTAPSDDSPASEWATWYSQTTYLVLRWLAEHGPATTRDLLECCNQNSRLNLRTNARKQGREELSTKLNEAGIVTEPGFHPLSLLVQGHPPGLMETSTWKAGDFSVQGATQTEILDMVHADKGERILDLCAAPGGKSTGMAEAADDAAHIFAYDEDQKRLAPLTKELERLGLTSVSILKSNHALRTEADGTPFDKVLVDAPCSNSGVLDKRAEARWRVSQETIDKLVHVQASLIKKASSCLRDGGTLVYSTCSIEAEENETLARSLDGQHGLRLISAERILPVLGLRDGGGVAVFRKEPAKPDETA